MATQKIRRTLDPSFQSSANATWTNCLSLEAGCKRRKSFQRLAEGGKVPQASRSDPAFTRRPTLLLALTALEKTRRK
jgi:hypothetical protein